MNPMRSPRSAPRRAQRGDIMLVTMIFLLVCLLGLVASMRDTIASTMLTGNTLARQKDVQVADISVRNAEAQMQSVGQDVPLQVSPAAIAQPWWRDVAPGTAGPDAAYWAACVGNSDATKRCSQSTVTIGTANLPYTALTVVQYTGRFDPGGCKASSGLTAMFYDIFTHVTETSGATSVTTETVYALCS